MDNQKTVFVGLSGGVDSSVAAVRLRQQGYNVVGVFIKVWQPDFLKCNWEQERLDAMRVAAKLDIPFLTCDAEAAYKQDVADYFIAEYQAGRTPNPDVMCNKYVKFGAFLDFARRHDADFVATGHYAQRKVTETGYELHRGVDDTKDQSYFLWTLTQEQLAQILLPVGDTEKTNIRAEAEAQDLVTAEKKDSQGICFLGAVDIPEFLGHFIDLQPGQVLDEQGSKIGEHRGALVYTIGQRHGFTVHTSSEQQQPHYVIKRDVEANTITVSTHKPTAQSAEQLTITDCNFIVYTPTIGDMIEIQTRYRQQPSLVEVKKVEGTTLTLQHQHSGESISPGQSCVLYREGRCLGGGIIAA